MLDVGWLFLGLVAVLASVAAVVTDDNAIAIVAGAIGMLAWLLWSFAAYGGIETAEGTVHQMWPLALFGTVLAFVPGLIALTGPVDLFGDARNAEVEEF